MLALAVAPVPLCPSWREEGHVQEGAAGSGYRSAAGGTQAAIARQIGTLVRSAGVDKP